MAARAIASGTISFGLVSIPVKLYTATSSKNVHFNMLHEKDKGRLKQQYLCSVCGDVVERDATIRGYEFAKNQYVVMSDEELGALERKSDRSIEIESFVPIEQVDPVYFEKSNLLGPDKGGQKAYKLLNRAMLSAGRVAIGRFSTRGRQQLVLIRPVENGLMMHGLYSADEVRSFDDVEFGDDLEIKKGELELAGQLIEQLSQPRFESEQYEDDYRRELLGAIERKSAGEAISVPEPAEAREQIIDLVAALKRSLAEKPARVPLKAAAARDRKPAKAKSGKGGGRSARSGSS
jgi:DNA end-binding protein Ku